MIKVHDLRHVPADVAEAWIDHIAANLRQQDLDEISAASGVDPAEGLRLSVRLSSHAYVVEGRDGLPAAVFGAAPHILPGSGIVWMVGTDAIRRDGMSIARSTRRYFDELQTAYVVLWNYIDARNEVSMRWLRWGGFQLLEKHPEYGVEKRPFYTFARIAGS